jgi:aldehyde dehydrogenase (NAD+)
VQRSIHDRFVARLVEMTQSIRAGDPMDPETQIGPIATEPQFRKVLDYIAIAKAEGAHCAAGGMIVSGQIVAPTIFTHVDNDMRIAQEEVFGPVLAVIPFDDEADAVRIANEVNFGLAAGVWTADLSRALRVSDRLDVGTVWVNTYRAVSFTSPFGGTKRSGLGFENGIEAIRSFMKIKSVWLSSEPDRNNPFVLR